MSKDNVTRYNVLTVRLSDVEVEQVNELCDKYDISASSMIRRMMFDQVDELDTKKEAA